MADEPDHLPRNGRGKALAVREAGVEYLIDLILELAALARKYGEVPIAIHLEAIIKARRAQEPAPER